jgi:hypothetical protein
MQEESLSVTFAALFAVIVLLGACRRTPFSLWLVVCDHFYARFAETPKLGEPPQTVGVS